MTSARHSAFSLRTGPATISVVGDLTLDHVLEADPTTATDEKVQLRRVRKLAGGTGGNAAAAAARLGAHVRLHTLVGDDNDSAWLLSETASDGVDVTAVRTRPGAPARAFILHEGEKRVVYTDMSIMAEFVDVRMEDLSSDDLIYVSYSPAIAAQLLDSSLASKTVVGIESWMVGELRSLRLLDRARLVITNEAGWRTITTAAPSLDSPVIETLGAAGARLHVPGSPAQHFPALKVTPVDATGAGDCFAGAVCRYLSDGTPLEDATRLATVAAGLATTAVGAREAHPTDAEVRTTLVTYLDPGSSPGC